MQKQATLTLIGISNDKVRPGDIKLPDYHKSPCTYFKMSIPVKNTGGAPAAMVDSERQGLLAAFTMTFKYGQKGKFQPFQAQPLTRIQREFRDDFGSEWEGYGDSTTGLATSIANGATTTLVLWMALSHTRRWDWGPERQDDLAAGKSQVETFDIELKQLTANLTAIANAGNFQINGNVTLDVIPYAVPSKGDPWAVQPEYVEFDETTIEVKKLPDGIPLRLSERTAVNASTSLTNVTVKIDDYVIVDQLSPKDLITSLNDIPNVPSEAVISDRETFLYKPRPYVQTKDKLPTGRLFVRQNVKDLATIKLGLRYLPIYGQDVLGAEFDNVAAAGVRNKAMRFVPLHVVQGRKHANKALALLEPYVAFDKNDREFESFPGWLAEPNKKGDFTVPHSILAAAKAEYTARAAAGEHKAAEDVVNSLAAAIPAAVQSGRGFNQGASPVLTRVQGYFR